MSTLNNSAQKLVSRLLGEDDEDGGGAPPITAVAADVLGTADRPPAEEERNEIVIARELLELIEDLRGTDGPEATEAAIERVENLAHELLVMHGAEEAEDEEGPPGGLPGGELPGAGDEGGAGAD